MCFFAAPPQPEVQLFLITTADHREAVTLQLTAWTLDSDHTTQKWASYLINTNTNQGEMRNTRFPPPEVEPHSWQRWKEGESDEKHAGRRNRKEKGRNRSNWSRIVRLTINWSCIVEALARKTLLWRHAILKTKQGLKVYHKQSKYHYSVTKSVNVPRIWVRTSPPDMAINVWDVFAHWYVLAYITNISSATGFHSHTHCITSKKKKGANQSNFNQPGV